MVKVIINELIFFQLLRSYQSTTTTNIFETVQLGPDLDNSQELFNFKTLSKLQKQEEQNL